MMWVGTRPAPTNERSGGVYPRLAGCGLPSRCEVLGGYKTRPYDVKQTNK